MATKKVDEVVVKIPQGVKTVKIEFGGDTKVEGVSKPTRKKICD